jgi:hypothetical protein
MSNQSALSFDQGTRVLRDEELEAVSGGNPFLALGLGALVGGLVGASAVDGFVADAVATAKEKLGKP